MRIKETIVAAGLISISSAALGWPEEALAQTPPVTAIAQRDATWGTVSNVTMVIGAGLVTLMPRVYYNDPEATVGWKGRWHVSQLTPALGLTALALLVDGPIRNAIQAPRPGCTLDQTAAGLAGSHCESYGMPSTQAYAAWGATGAGTAIFLVDTFRYSQGRFNAGAFLGNVGIPLVLSVLSSVGRGVTVGNTLLPNGQQVPTQAYESPMQVLAGSLSGFASGALFGVAYTLFQRPNCGYGNSLVCW